MCPGRNPLQFRDIKLVLIQTFITTNSYFIQSYCHHLTCLIVLTQMRRFELLCLLQPIAFQVRSLTASWVHLLYIILYLIPFIIRILFYIIFCKREIISFAPLTDCIIGNTITLANLKKRCIPYFIFKDIS